MRTPGSVVLANPTALNKEAKRKGEKMYLYISEYLSYLYMTNIRI